MQPDQHEERIAVDEARAEWAIACAALEQGAAKGQYEAAVRYAEMHEQGLSYRQIADAVTAAGFRIGKSTVQRRVEALRPVTGQGRQAVEQFTESYAKVNNPEPTHVEEENFDPALAAIYEAVFDLNVRSWAFMTDAEVRFGVKSKKLGSDFLNEKMKMRAEIREEDDFSAQELHWQENRERVFEFVRLLGLQGDAAVDRLQQLFLESFYYVLDKDAA